MEYETIICFETHVELKTQTKLFCRCQVGDSATPNSRTCPVCTGQPGALPVLNKKAVEYCVLAGLALNCSINRRTRFARKNYFYPDLPKGYQISQYEHPFCENGYLEITGDDGHPYLVGIKRIHLEEDAGKLVHSSSSFGVSDYSLVDYNRSCVPLIEIVADHTRNPLRSLREARAYLEKVRRILIYIGVSDCIIEKGQFRCDVNISIRPKGSQDYGNRAEIKNMASFKSIMDALEYETKRQSEVLETGGQLYQETRLFDEEKKMTVSMRSKENAPDYRYFPDPDLVEVDLDDEFIGNISKNIPELPDKKIDRLIKESGITKEDAFILTKEKNISDFFACCLPLCRDKKRLSRWVIKELFRLLKGSSLTIDNCPIKPEAFSELINILEQGGITDQNGRVILDEMFRTGSSPDTIINKKGFKTIQDFDQLEKVLNEVIDENPNAVAQIKEGMTKPIGFLIGGVMKKTGSQANPKKVRELIIKKLGIKNL